MGDTVKEFFLFISDNPLMMFLSGAIVLLFIILIIVLFAGGKKEKKQSKKKLENTTELFTTPIEAVQTDSQNSKTKEEKNSEASDKLLEPKPSVLKEENFNLEETLEMDYNEEEAPININDALNLKKEREVVPNIENTTSTPKQFDETDIIPIPVELNKTASNKLEVETVKEPIMVEKTRTIKIPSVDAFERKDAPVIPSSINEDTKSIDETIDKLINEVNLIKTGQIEFNGDYSKIDKMIDEANLVKTRSMNLDPLSNAEISYKIESIMNDLNLIKEKTEELPKQSNTGPIKNTNIFTGFAVNDIEEKKVPNLVNSDDDLDDIELPKLKTEDTSPLNILKGESFDID